MRRCRSSREPGAARGRTDYILRREEEFRHPVEGGVTVGDLVDLVEHRAASRRRIPSARMLSSSLSALDPTQLIDWASEAAQRRLPKR